MDMTDEPKSVFDMYGPDSTKPGTYAANCLLARRLVGKGAKVLGAEIDNERQRQYVYMVRDLGARRQPATVLTIGGGDVGGHSMVL